MKILTCLINILFFTTLAFPQSMSHETYEYAESLAEQAEKKYRQGDYKEAIRLGYEALPIYEKVFGTKENKDYAACLSNIALFYSKLGDYSEAIRLSRGELDLTEKIFKRESKEYVHSLQDVGTYYFNDKKYTEALLYATEALNIGRVVYNNCDTELTIIMYCVACSNAMLGNFQESSSLCREGIQVSIKNSDKENELDFKRLLYGNLLNEQLQELGKGNFTERAKILAEAISLLKEVNPNNVKTLANLISGEADCYEHNGMLLLARQKAYEQIEILETNRAENIEDYLHAKQNLARLEGYLGNEEVASLINSEIKNIADNINSKVIKEQPSILLELTDIYADMGEYSSAYRCLDKATDIALQRNNIEPFFIQQVFLAHAELDKKLGCYDDAISSYKRALALTHKIKEEVQKSAYGVIHFKLGLCYLATNDYEKAHSNFSDAIIFEGFDTKSAQHAESIAGAIWSANRINNLLSVKVNTNRLIDLLRTLWDKNLCDLDEQNRNSFFMNYENYLEWLIPQMVYEHPQSESLISSGYDASLIYKGLLVEVSRALNFAEQKKYFSKVISTEWTDIREKLKENDVAVEFVSFDLNKDSTMYMAYVLKKGMKYPVVVKLFEEQQLKNAKDTYTLISASQLVWKPLENYLNGAKNVYFSPSGELYNIAIESLPHWSDGTLMSDKWNMYRLSSTRELALVKDKKDIKQANIYGGVKYDTDEQTLAANSRIFAKSRALGSSPFYQLADTLNMRSGVNYLPSTREEVVEIDKTLRQKHVNTNLRTESLATESDFKNLDGKNMNLIHVATHGFYWTEREAKYHDDLSFLMIGDNDHKYVEDKALTRSGLLMAGANNALMGKQLPEGVDDGILTAKEISQLDLQGTDLVVLSACQTGLGEIKGDGVFGLQRGFKKAGVQSILMSLWKVDDDATKLLMTQFYKNLTSGTGKHEALKQAQKYVRENKDKDYQDPYFWAAFVLLDAID